MSDHDADDLLGDDGRRAVSVGRELFGAERQRAIDAHVIWLMTGKQFERVINDDAPIVKFARSQERRVSIGKRHRKDLARWGAYRDAQRAKQCG